MTAPRIDDLDAAETLHLVELTVRRRRAVEVDDFYLASHWAVLHGADPRRHPDGTRAWAEDRLVQPGGEGTPEVREFSIAEFAVARQIHPQAAHRLLADILDLQHRLPRTWAAIESLAAESWVGRRVAAMTRTLPADTVGLVDVAVAEAIGSQAPSRVFALAEAKVIEADPVGHAAKVAAARRRRYVALTRTDEHGLRCLIARIDAGDAAWVDATVDRVADILAATRPEATRDERRAEAFGWLARPAELLALLLEGNQREPDNPAEDGPADEGAVSTGAAGHSPADDAPAEDGPADEEEPYRCRALAFPADLLAALRGLDPDKLRPRAVLYLHLHQAAVEGACSAVARVEGIGPMLPAQLADLLRGVQVTVKPVIDLNDQVSTDAYEHPEAVKERVLLRTPGEYFPHATTLSRGVEFDHVTPYDRTGPPGQTGTHNCGPLTRRRHRLKTHAGYTVSQIGPAEYLWRSPHGLRRYLDSRGTHLIPLDLARQLDSKDATLRAMALLTLALRAGRMTPHDDPDPPTSSSV